MDLVVSLRAFVAVVTAGSFTEAADEVGVPQPVLGRRIKAFEHELGGLVFDRSRRPIQTTAQASATWCGPGGGSGCWSVVDLLARIWLDDIARPAATAEVRRRMGKQTSAHRLSSDLQADTIVVASKTGTFLNLRHDVGVVQTDRGDRIVVVALTRSSQRALIQQPVDLAIGLPRDEPWRLSARRSVVRSEASVDRRQPAMQ